MFRDLLLVICGLLVAVPMGLQAQNREIRGVVLDPDGAAIAGVQVRLMETLTVTTSDVQGEFLFQGVSPGRYTLRASARDFEAEQVPVDVSADLTARTEIRLYRIRAAVTSIQVLGESVEALMETPGSLFIVSREELRGSYPMDANEVMRRVPGVVINEQSGPVATRLNVGIRGLNPDRSRAVLILEDGLPVTLAPYGEPETYYSPAIDRMERVEVVKGSGQVLYGPQTIGGVVNFISPDPPARTRAEFNLQGGQRGFFSGNGMVGGSSEDQKAGWLLNFLHKRGDGFRDFFFDIDDVQGKFTLKPSDRQTFAVRVGYYDENSNSTYLGLTTPMYQENPSQNPVPSDFLKVKRVSGSLGHTVALSPTTVWSSTLFGYSTTRDWARADFDRSPAAGRNYWAVFGDTSVPNGALFIRNTTLNRNRSFDVLGAQTGVSAVKQTGSVSHAIDAGIRYIGERMNDKNVIGAAFDARTGAIRDDEDRYGNALSAYFQDRIRLTPRLTISPGVRLEHYNYERHILVTRIDGVPSNVDRRSGDGVTKAIPGIGVAFQLAQPISLFAGVHRGFAPPRIKDAILVTGVPLELDAELSWNYEAGIRIQGHRAIQAEFTYFRLDFQNQIIPAAQSGGATTTLVNGGETLHQGLESSLRVDWAALFGSSYTIYTDIRHMYLGSAQFTRDALFLNNRLPYAPRNTFSFLLGVRHRRGLGFQLDSSYISSQFADNNETVLPSMDGTVGILPGYTLWNFNTDYSIQRERFQLRPYFTVKNVSDLVYIASRAPQGIQPGMFRQANIGLRISF